MSARPPRRAPRRMLRTSPLLAPFAAALLPGLALGLGPRARDLDVGVPPGSPLEWSASLPAYTPPARPLFPRTAPPDEKEKESGSKTSARVARPEADVRFATAFGQVRILTWDLGGHLEWTAPPKTPETGGSGDLAAAPVRYGEPLYWLSLAPLLRLLLHPDALARSETLAHLVELGEPVLPVLAAASAERGLAPACETLRALIRADSAGAPAAPRGGAPREDALARFVLEECLRDRPHDPSDDFGRRLFLFSEDAEPVLCRYAQHPSLSLARGAVAALGRYETRSAVQFLASYAGRAEDPVALVRALAALGRYRGPLDVGPLVARLGRTEDPVLRAALIGALGRLGARDAAPLLLQLGESARKAKDSDLLISVLSALARVAWIRAEPEVAAFCARVGGDAGELAKPSSPAVRADLPDPSELRATIVEQLALLARTQAAPTDERARADVLALARAGPLDPRLSALGVGGTDPIASIPAAVRMLYLEGLARAGPEGLEQLAALVRRDEVEAPVRARALGLLPLDQRGALALSFLQRSVGAGPAPIELRVQSLEILIADLHPSAVEQCKLALASEALAEPRPPAGELYLALRAVRFLSEAGKLRARDLLPLYPLIQRPPRERAANVAELRARLAQLAAAAEAGEREKELERRAGALFDYVVEQRMNPLLDPDTRDARVDALVQALESLRDPRAPDDAAAQLVPQLVALLLGGEAEVEDPGRALFQPLVPLAEELVLALGRTGEPLAVELLLSLIQGGARELRGHACLALGMCARPELARQLLPALQDGDAFVRFAASESLRALTGREPTVDWLSATPTERRAAAEELERWLATQPR